MPFPEGIVKEKPLRRIPCRQRDCVQRSMSREWDEIHKPLPVVLQKFDEEEKQLLTGTVGCPETSEGSPEGDWCKLDFPSVSGGSLLPLTDVKQPLQGKACLWLGPRPLPAPASEMEGLPPLLAKPCVPSFLDCAKIGTIGRNELFS